MNHHPGQDPEGWLERVAAEIGVPPSDVVRVEVTYRFDGQLWDTQITRVDVRTECTPGLVHS